MRRTEMCDGKRLAEIRAEQGLTQSELARKAGYSERLIRKAESGDSITYSAIKDIATALSLNGKAVQPDDLTCSPIQLVKEFLHAFAYHECEMAAQVRHFIDDHFLLDCAGDPQQMPFAGRREGIEGLDQWVRSYFSVLMRPQKDFYKPEFFSRDNTVVAWGQDWAHAPNVPFPPIWVSQKFEFAAGKLVYFENRFDTGSRSKHLAQAET